MSEKIYSASTIISLKWHEAIRKRPGMYIGEINLRSFTRLLKSVFTNAFLELDTNHVVLHFEENQSGQLVFKNIKKTVDDNFAVRFAHYSFHSNIELQTLNALSSKLEMKLFDKSDKLVLHQIYKKGLIVKGQNEMKSYEGTTMTIEFKLDETIWQDVDWNMEYLLQELRDLGTLYKNAKFEIHYQVEKEPCRTIFQYKNGLKDRLELEKYNRRGNTYFDTYVEKELDDFSIEVAFSFRDYSVDMPFIKSYVNDFHTVENGAHVDGLLKGLTYGAMQYFQKNKLTSRYRISEKGIEEELLAIIQIKMKNPTFSGCVKNKLASSEIIEPIAEYISTVFFEKIENNKKATEELIRKFEIPKF